MNTEKKLAIIALALWALVAAMAYVNIWASVDGTTTETQSDWRWNPNTNHYESYDIVTTIHVDVFPHESLVNSIYVTAGIAAFPTLVLLFFDFKEDSKKHNES
jgi:hypothetical protein